MAMTTTTKILAAAVAAGGVVYLATRPSTAKAAEKKLSPTAKLPTSTGELPGLDDDTTGAGFIGDDYTVPAFPASQQGTENSAVLAAHAQWASAEAASDASDIKDGTLGLAWRIDDITDRAFNANYPTWAATEGDYPRDSTQGIQWVEAWERMNAKMSPLVMATLSTYGI